MRFIDRCISTIATKVPRLAGAKMAVYRLAGVQCEGCDFRGGVYIDVPRKVRFGTGCFCNRNVNFYVGNGGDGVEIDVGSNVFFGMGATLCCVGHEIGPQEKRAGEQKYEPIRIGDGCWIGANSTILGGVTIGAGSVAAAGAVVVRDIEENCVYAGVPARKVKELL